MLESIKAHAEGQTVSDTADTVQVLLWCLTFVAFVTSAVLVLMGRQWRRRLLTFVIAGLLFQLLTLVQPALLVGVPCVAAILLGVWAPRRLLAGVHHPAGTPAHRACCVAASGPPSREAHCTCWFWAPSAPGSW